MNLDFYLKLEEDYESVVQKIPNELHKKIYELCVIEGKGQKEVAKELDVDYGKLKVYLKRAREFVRKELAKLGYYYKGFNSGD